MKICIYCKRKSYSASGRGKWRCPYCGRDITGVELQNPDRVSNTAKVGTGCSEDENKQKIYRPSTNDFSE